MLSKIGCLQKTDFNIFIVGHVIPILSFKGKNNFLPQNSPQDKKISQFSKYVGPPIPLYDIPYMKGLNWQVINCGNLFFAPKIEINILSDING